MLKILICLFAVSCFVSSAEKDRKENAESLGSSEKIDQLTFVTSDYDDTEGETKIIDEVSTSYSDQTEDTFEESFGTSNINEDETDDNSKSASNSESTWDFASTSNSGDQFTATSDSEELDENTESTELEKINTVNYTEPDQDATTEQEETTQSPDESSMSTFEKSTTDETTTEKISNPCDLNPCENGGTCRLRGNDQVECKCPKGTSGRRCEKVDWCKVLRDDGTTGKSYCDKGEARCVSHQRNRNFTCVCYNRRKEFNYDIGKCKTKDMCTLNPCKNGGICTTSGYKAQCECPEGVYGRTCERVNWCQIKMENGRSGADYCDQGEAKCVENRKNKNFTCVCYNNRLTFDEELMECIEKVKDTEAQAAEAQKECDKSTVGYDECKDKSAICYIDPYSYIGYVCVCKDGSMLEAESCECIAQESCSEDSEGYKICQQAFAHCVVNYTDVLGYSCYCPNGRKFDAVNGCSGFVAYATVMRGDSKGSQSTFLLLSVSLSVVILLAFGVAAFYYLRKIKKTPMITIEN